MIAIPPGETIKEQLEYQKISRKEFYKRMGFAKRHMRKLLKGKVELAPEIAERLEKVLGVPASFWINLEKIYQRKKRELDKLNRNDYN